MKKLFSFKTMCSFLSFMLVMMILVTNWGQTLSFLTDSTAAFTNYLSAGVKYTLKYHPNAGNEDVVVPNDQVSFGEGKFNISADKPVRNDYVFTKWNTKADGTGTDVNIATTYTTSERHTDLYAQWEIGYTVIYDANGGINPPATDTYVGTEASHEFNIKPAGSMTHKKDHKIFLGWSTIKQALKPEDTLEPEYNSTGKYGYTGANFDGDNTKTLEKTITLTEDNRTITLYAVWATHYKLIYSANPALNGTGNVPKTQERVSTKKVVEFQIPENPNNADKSITPTRTDASKGYYFGWWAEEADNYNEHQGYQYGEKVKVYETPRLKEHEDPWKVIYAIYKPPETLGLYYNANGGSGVPNSFWGSVLAVEQPVKVEETPVPTRSNYVFMGYSKDRYRKHDDFKVDGKKDVNPGDEIQINIFEDAKPTLYAVWRNQHRFSLTFNPNGGKVYYIGSNGRWTNYSSATYYSPYINDVNHFYEDYTFEPAEFSGGAVFAYKAPDASGKYEFLGWSYKSNPTEADVDIAVTQPVDINNPQDDEGIIKQNIKVEEGPTHCTSVSTHNLPLYAVYRKTPLHTFNIVFMKNIDDRGNMISDETIVDVANNNKAFSGSLGKVTSLIKDGDKEIVANSVSGANIYTSETKPIEELPYYELNANFWQTENPVIPAATKSSTAVVSYEFLGWSYKPRSTVADIQVDSNGRITQAIRTTEPTVPASDCEGTQHYVLLFPVFKPIPKHTFKLYFDLNKPNISGLTSYIYYKNTNGKWTYTTNGSSYNNVTDVFGNEKLTGYAYSFTSALLPTSTTSWGFNKEELKGKGLYCTMADSNNSLEITFLGWSYKKYGLGEASINDVDFPVVLPSDPSKPNETATGTDGIITKDVIISEPTSGGPQCTSSTGQIHNMVLYAVWSGEPLHQYQLMFAGDEEGTTIHYKNSSGNWTSTPGSNQNVTINGVTETGVKGTWNGIFSPALKISDPSTGEFTWYASDFNKIGVYASRKDTDTTRYEFLGWTRTRGKKTADAGLEANFVTEGNAQRSYITKDITIEDPDFANCKDNTDKIHKDILYAVWKETPIHTFKVKFDLNGGSYYTFFNGKSWTYSSSSSYGAYNYPSEGFVPVSSTGNSYTFTKDYWKNTAKGVGALRNDDYYYSYTFVGWAKEKNGNAVYFLDNEGYLDADILVKCNDEGTDCNGGNHEITLYAVWEPTSLTRTLTVKFDLNTANGEEDLATGKPEDLTIIETYDKTTGWLGKHTFTIPGQIPTYKNMAFVGWAASKNEMPGNYGLPNESTVELKNTTSTLNPNYEMSCSKNKYDKTDTLYAIWAYEYQLVYYANHEDGAHAPSMEHEYTNSPNHIYKISKNCPVREGYKFVGWSTSPTATQAEYSPFENDGLPSQMNITADPSGSTSNNLYAVWEKE